MNQILYNNNLPNNKNKDKNEFSISIFIISLLVILIILLIMLSFNVYAKDNKNNEEDVVENIEEQVNKIENILIVEKNSIQENSNIEAKIQEEELKENSKKNEILYTTKSGENYSIIGKLNIPTLNIKYDILSTSSAELLEISLNRYWGAYPNEIGNMVVIGHNYKNSKFFGNLLKIKIGDIVKITDNNGKTLDYSVYDTYIIDPDDNACTSQLTDGHTEITLITCYYENGNAHATKRFVVKARAINL